MGRPKTAKLLMKQGQIGYVWSAISKTVFKIFLDPKSMKIWIFQNLLAEDGVGRQKNGKTVNETRPVRLRLKRDFQNCL